MSTHPPKKYFFLPTLDIGPGAWYNVRMSTISNIGIPLPLTYPPAHADRREELLSFLNCGWIVVAFRKADGERVERLCTRNPSILKAYASAYEITQIRENDPVGDHLPNILYYDYSAGSLRSFRVDCVLGVYTPRECPELNH
jgi:hypothetical protein